MKKTVLLLLCKLVFISITTHSYSQVDTQRFDSLKTELTKYIQNSMLSTKTVGLSIALVDNQDIIWSEGFGFEDELKNIRATDKTIYRAGSISKLFTATSVMQLSEQGKIDIDAPIQKYIPEFKIKSRLAEQGDITPRNMMSHQSGLPSDINFQFFHHNPEPFTNVVEHLSNEYTCAPPNTYFSYSNAAYSLLGVLVEKTSNENFVDYTQKNLLEKMDMVNSSFVLTPEMEKQFSKAYVKGKEYDEPLLRDLPAGGLYSTVTDLSNFMKMVFNDGNYNGCQIIKAETLAEMLTKQNTKSKLEFGSDIGLGYFINSTSWSYAGGEAGHAGDNYAFHAQLLTFPEQKIGVIVMVNTDQGINPSRLVAYEILKKYLQMKTGLKAPKKASENKVEIVKLSKQEASKYTGDYIINSNAIQIKEKHGELIAKQGLIKMVLSYTNQDYFIVKALVLGVYKVVPPYKKLMFRNIEGKDYVQFSNSGDNYIIGYKTSKPTIPDAWKKRTGKYEIINDDTKFRAYDDIRLFLKDGYLRIGFVHMGRGKASMTINPISENQALLEGVGRGSGTTLEFQNDELYFSGLRLKKVGEK